jgi:hypothetical protein
MPWFIALPLGFLAGVAGAYVWLGWYVSRDRS